MATASEWMNTWERARGLRPALRGVALLACAGPASSEEELASLPVGERDCRLLALRRELFGSVIECVTSCPACDERADIAFAPQDLAPAAGEVATGPIVIDAEGYRIRCRLPDSRDLAAASEAPEVEIAAAWLLERCVIAAERDGAPLPPVSLPPAARESLERELGARDPLAAITLAVRCPACAHEWTPLFDIESHLWQEVDRWIAELLGEVHTLAGAYGWREQDILAMSGLRRSRYLELARRGVQ